MSETSPEGTRIHLEGQKHTEDHQEKQVEGMGPRTAKDHGALKCCRREGKATRGKEKTNREGYNSTTVKEMQYCDELGESGRPTSSGKPPDTNC